MTLHKVLKHRFPKRSLEGNVTLLFWKVTDGVTRGNSHKTASQEVQISGKLFHLGVTLQWNKSPRETWDPPPSEFFKTQLGKAMLDLILSWPQLCFERGLG